MMFTPHQADAVRRALRKGLDQEDPATGLDGRLRDALADKGRARFTADQKDDVRSALRDEKNLRVDLGARRRRVRARVAQRIVQRVGLDGLPDVAVRGAERPRLVQLRARRARAETAARR